MEGPKLQDTTIKIPEQSREGARLTSVEKLRGVMARISSEVNEGVKGVYGLDGLVDESLHMNVKFFLRKHGGPYDKESISADRKRVDKLDRDHSSADDLNVQKHFREHEGIATPEGIVEKHLKTKEESKGNQAEMIITALLHKILKERFLVVRASTFDDYMHGVDNLIIDKETGAVICAFDEVVENQGDKEKGASKKIDKVKKIAIEGGTEAKYGISLKEGVLTREYLRNIPVFYLTLESKDLIELTDDLYNNREGATKAEERLFGHLVRSIKEQKEMLEKLNLPAVMKRKLGEFDSSLAVLEGFVAKQ